MTDSIDCRLNVASETQILEHLRHCDGDFVPPLTSRVELSGYAHKIATSATRFEAWSDSSLVGLVAAYCNDPAREFAYITSVSVLGAWTKRRIASRLLDQCVEHVKSAKIRKIRLEVAVDNRSAIKLYEKFGFVEGARNGAFVAMTLPLNGDESSEACR